VRFKVLTATGMKIAVFWNVVPCSLVDNIDQITQCKIPQKATIRYLFPSNVEHAPM
jgi:hypothetical protein